MNFLCKHPFIYVSITPDGHYQLCPHSKKLNPIHNTKNTSLHDFFYSEYSNNIREDMLDGVMSDDITEMCSECINLEKNNLPSHRRMLWDFKKPEIEIIHLNNIGTKCNLKCITCGPERSSTFGTLIDNWSEFDIEQIKNIKEIWAIGGEALLMKRTKDIVDKSSDDSTIFIVTNSTTFPKWILDYKEKITIVMSIDGIGKVDEYIRLGTIFNRKLKNMDKFVKNFKHRFIFTLNMINYSYMNDVIDFLKERYDYDLDVINRLQNPPFLDCVNVPNNHVGHANHEVFLEGIRFLKYYDIENGKNLLDICPEWQTFYEKEKPQPHNFSMANLTMDIPPLTIYDRNELINV